MLTPFWKVWAFRKQKGGYMTEKPYDFSGYVTKNDILCTDGRTIRRDAFLENDGKVVPMVWMHKHDAPDNVLGHMVLENRPDGVYGYGYFNDTDKGRTAKMLVEHGDISCMSIWANHLKQRGGDVIHGLINEVSLVLNGANRGALIDSRLAHGDFSEDEAFICMGDDEPIMVNEDNYLIHYGRKGMKWGESIFGDEEETAPNRPRSREVNITGEGKPLTTDSSSGTGPVGQNNSNRPVSGATKADSSAVPTKNAQPISTSSYDGSGKESNADSSSGKPPRPNIFLTSDAPDMSGFPPAIRKKLEENAKQGNAFYESVMNMQEQYENLDTEAERAQLRNSPEFANAVSGYREALNQQFSMAIPVFKNAPAIEGVSVTETDRLQTIAAFDTWVKETFFPEVAASEKRGDKVNGQKSGSITQTEKSKASKLSHADSDTTIGDVLDTFTEDQLNVLFYLLAKTAGESGNISHSEEDDNMKNNVFDQSTTAPTLSAEDVSALFSEAKRTHASMKDTVLAHADDYGITNIEYLFPDDRQLTSAPVFIKKPDEWVKAVMGGVSHTPFSRVKTVFADITEADARAKGYVKGNRKMEEVITLLKRKTDPQTVFKKQKLDRDDQIDITDFNVVAWLKTEMRMKLDEELAQAFLIGDLRSPASEDKIGEDHIRPIWKDDDLFVIRKAIPLTATMTPDDRARKFIRMAVKARKDYRGKGNPSLFTTEDLLTDMMLIEDTTGRPLYDSEAKLCTALRVKEIIPVPAMENVSRIVGTSTMNLMGIIVNLADYTVGADKGGSIEMFEDFDIDFNQNKYLIETRCSGALTAPYSAIVIEGSESMYLDMEPIDGSETQYGKSVSDLQTGIVVNEDSIAGTLKYVTGYTGFSGDPDEQKGNFIALQFDAPSGATTTVELLGGKHEGSPVTLDSDMTAVFQIANKSQKIRVVSSNDGMEIAKTYSLRLLKLNGPTA